MWMNTILKLVLNKNRMINIYSVYISYFFNNFQGNGKFKGETVKISS